MKKYSKKFIASLPKKISGAGVLLFYKGKLLIVNPTYKDYWSVPGGVVEKNESPYEAVMREVKEEINLKIKIKKLLVIEYKGITHTGTTDTYQFMFLGQELNQALINKIELQKEEISEYKIVDIKKAYALLSPHISRRLKVCMKVIQKKETIYIENGESIKSST